MAEVKKTDTTKKGGVLIRAGKLTPGGKKIMEKKVKVQAPAETPSVPPANEGGTK